MVSCLISAYYAREFIHARLFNLIDHERIVVCQAGSYEEEVAKGHAGVIVITTPDIPTIGKAWNLAYRAATCDYVTTANTDDIIYRHGYEQMARILDNNPGIGLVFGNVDITTGGPPQPWKRIPDISGRLANPERILGSCFIGPMPLWRRNWYDIIGGFDEDMVSADWEYWMCMYSKGANFWYIDAALGCYNKRQDSLEHRNRSILVKEKRILREQYRMVNA